MTFDERLEMLMTQLPDAPAEEEELLETLLYTARDIINERRFPFRKELPDDVEPKYEGLQIRIAKELYTKLGIEGETQHSEAGMTRTFTSSGGDVTKQLLQMVIPLYGGL